MRSAGDILQFPKIVSRQDAFPTALLHTDHKKRAIQQKGVLRDS